MPVASLTLDVVAGIVVIVGIFVAWALSRMAALGDREDR